MAPCFVLIIVPKHAIPSIAMIFPTSPLGWKWPAAGCLVWAAVTAFTAWVQLDMLEQEMPVGAGHTLEMAEGQSV